MATKSKLKNSQPTLNPNLKGFWTASKTEDGANVRVRVLYGGRTSSKTWDAAGFAIFLASNYCVKFLCTRQYQNRIEESVYAVLIVQIERFGLRDDFRILNNKIIHLRTGSEFIFYGLWRNIDEIKSLEGVDVCWIEEAHNLLEEQWRILRDTIRKDNSQFWIVFNPRLATDFVYRRFVIDPPSGTLVRKINYDENPFVSETMRETIEAVRAEDEEEYRHVYLGEPVEDDENVIIRRRWLQACVDAHLRLEIEPSGTSVLGLDVADGGDDKNALVSRQGQLLAAVQMWKAAEDELMATTARAWAAARTFGNSATLRYDSIGVGAHVGSRINELNESIPAADYVDHEKFNAAGSVMAPDAEYRPGVRNRDHFLNIKAQAWWSLADRAHATYRAAELGERVDPEEMLFIDSNCGHLENLIAELSTPKRTYNSNGKLQVEKKEQLERRGIPSPNLADAAVIAFAPTDAAPVLVLSRRNKRRRRNANA